MLTQLLIRRGGGGGEEGQPLTPNISAPEAGAGGYQSSTANASCRTNETIWLTRKFSSIS
jgi:hypothetical protein